MSILYDIVDTVWYYDFYGSYAGIGIVIDHEFDNKKTSKTSLSITYKIWDANTEVLLGGYENPSFINMRACDLAPLTCYNSKEEFIKSRVN